MTVHAIHPDAPPVEMPAGYPETLTALIGQYGVTMSIRQVAIACGLVHGKGATKGEPNPRLVLDLVKAGRLRPVDPSQPQHRWTFASATVAVYIVGGESH